MDTELARRKMMDLLERYENDLSLGQRQIERVSTENGELYNHWHGLSQISAFFLGEHNKFFLGELSMAYHMIEETTDRTIPFIEKQTIDGYMERAITDEIDPNKELEKMLKNNSVYGEYVLGTWDHWKKLYPFGDVSYLARHLVFLDRLVETQIAKNSSAQN